MNRLELIPAIDIRDGKCVRLYKGDFEQVTAYDIDPVARASEYALLGAATMHIVDLDGAKAGRPENLDLIRKMADQGSMQIQLGGGIRTDAAFAEALQIADRIVIGSLAISEPDRVKAWMLEYGSERITLGLDIRFDAAGTARVTTHGWTQDSGLSLDDAIAGYVESGLKHVLCTDVDRDGAMAGPSIRLYSQCVKAWPDIRFQASGGVRHAADLLELQNIGISAAVSGKALLDGKMTTEEIKRFLPNG